MISRYKNPKYFHFTNLVLFFLFNAVSVIFWPDNLWGRIGGLLPLVLFVVPFIRPQLLIDKGSADGKEGEKDKKDPLVLEFDYLYLWVLSIGIIMAMAPILLSKDAPTIDEFVKRVPFLFLSVFIMVLSYFISKLLTRQEANLALLNSAAEKLKKLPETTDKIMDSATLFKNQTLKLMDTQKELVLLGEIEKSQADFMVNTAKLPSEQNQVLTAFHRELSHYSKNMFEVINKHIDKKGIPLALAMLFKRYLNHSFNKIGNDSLSFKTSFANYADIVQELVETFDQHGGYSFYTLLILSPSHFFNLRTNFSEEVWIKYLEYNRLVIAANTNYTFKRYFLTCNPPLQCINDNCRQTIRTFEGFLNEIRRFHIRVENSYPSQEDKASLTTIENQLIGQMPKNVRQDFKNIYEALHDSSIGFHIIEEDTSEFEKSDKTKYMSLLDAISLYHQNREFYICKFDASFCSASALPLDIFAVKNDNSGEWIFALGTKGTDIYSEHIELSMYFPELAEWGSIQERLNYVFIEPNGSTCLTSNDL